MSLHGSCYTPWVWEMAGVKMTCLAQFLRSWPGHGTLVWLAGGKGKLVDSSHKYTDMYAESGGSWVTVRVYIHPMNISVPKGT